MYKKISLLFFLFISNIFFAQTDTPQVKEIKDILSKSGEYLNKLECDKSMLLAKTALQKAIKIDNPEQTARAYNLIGLNLEQYSDFKKAIFFYQKGLAYVGKISNNFVISSLHTNIANCYCFRKIDFKTNHAVERKNYRLVQTPQCFKAEIIKKAYQQDFSEEFTDDASVLEAIGTKINLVQGNPENIKITTEVDLKIAQALMP
jgi:tetratricopeptide (TPR) repeat protein